MKRKNKILLTIYVIVMFISILFIENIYEIDKKDVYVDVFKIDDKTKIKEEDKKDVIVIDDIQKEKIDETESIPEKKKRKSTSNYKSSSYEKNETNIVEKNNDSNDNEDEENLIVDWLNEKKVDIFSNSYFENSKIAPGVSSDYYFIVKNDRKENIIYDINFTEKNDSNIPIKYRLKKNNGYVVGSDTAWVNASNLNINNVLINSKENDSYILEWKWDYYTDNLNDATDTIKGENVPDYKLTINVKVRSE